MWQVQIKWHIYCDSTTRCEFLLTLGSGITSQRLGWNLLPFTGKMRGHETIRRLYQRAIKWTFRQN